MNPYEISAIIEEELPSVNREIKKTFASGNPYKIMAALCNFAKKRLEQHDLPAVVKCLHVADKIYIQGSLMVKNAVENVFVFSLTTLRCICNKVEWNVIRAKMPESLSALYTKQVYTSGI